MSTVKQIGLAMLTVCSISACKKDAEPVIVLAPPSAGVERIQFNGLAGSEIGANAGNSVFLDLSSETATPVLRAGWDLAFWCGDDFRVALNHTTSAGANVTSKFDLAAVNASDTAGLTLATSQTAPDPAQLAYFDAVSGNISQTVIPAVSATESANPVIIINRGTGGGIAARPWIKLRVFRNGATGYRIQYAGINATTFQTAVIEKNSDYNFKHFSFDNGPVTAEPEKLKWDLTWSYSVYETNFGNGNVPYNFSDLIAVNHHQNVQVRQKLYADAATATAAYTAFNKDSIIANPVTTGRWTIGSNWRSTQPATGARQDRFYIIEDVQGNYYKLKCISMGIGADNGIRGRPEFKYTRISM